MVPFRGMRASSGRSMAALVATAMLPALVAAAGAQEAVDPAAIHTRLVAIRPDKQGQARPIVALANPTGPDDPDRLKDTVGGILARELFRQALLIAARDELGLATRDELLGDAAPAAAAGDPQAELITVLRAGDGKASRVVIRRTDGPNTESLLAQDLPGTKPPFGELPRLVEAAETLSRTGFPAALRKLGLEGRPNARRDDAGLPAGVEERLWRLGLYRAVRGRAGHPRGDPDRRRVARPARGAGPRLCPAGPVDGASLASRPQGVQGPRAPVRAADGGPRPQGLSRALAPRLCRVAPRAAQGRPGRHRRGPGAGQGCGRPVPPGLGRPHRGVCPLRHHAHERPRRGRSPRSRPCSACSPSSPPCSWTWACSRARTCWPSIPNATARTTRCAGSARSSITSISRARSDRRSSPGPSRRGSGRWTRCRRSCGGTSTSRP